MYCLCDCFKEILGCIQSVIISGNVTFTVNVHEVYEQLPSGTQSYLFGISKFYEFPPEETSEKPVYPCRYLYTLIYCK